MTPPTFNLLVLYSRDPERLAAFYERLGFVAEGAEFDDAGIPHYLMRRRL